MSSSSDACPACGAGDARPIETEWGDPLWRCDECGSAFVWPRPDPSELRDRYEKEHQGGKWQALFEDVPDDEWTGRARLLERMLDGPDLLLDVGCGDGRFLEVAERRSWSVIGTEVSLEGARLARKRLGRGRVVVSTTDALTGDASFGAVTFWDVLEHVPDPLEALASACARLRSGGVAVATMPNATGVTARLHGKHWKYWRLDAYGHLTHFSREGLETLFRRVGLELVLSRTDGSTDLRELPEIRGWGRPPGLLVPVLDRMSGLLARIAVPLGWGNTLTVAGRAS